MIHGFDTEDEAAAAGALLVYAAWRSRDRRRFKVTPDVWAQVERFVKSAAKRAPTLPAFLDRLLPRLLAGTINPAYCASDCDDLVTLRRLDDGHLVERADRRVFLTRILQEAAPGPVLAKLYRETVLIVLLVRDRIERERPHERAIEEAGDGLHCSTAEEIAAMVQEDVEKGVFA